MKRSGFNFGAGDCLGRLDVPRTDQRRAPDRHTLTLFTERVENMSRPQLHDHETVYYYFERALQDVGRNDVTKKSSVMVNADGNSAIFSVVCKDLLVQEIHFRCTTCVTLVGLCEHLAELASGSTVAESEAITAELLLQLHPEIPSYLKNRAGLTVRAFRAALANARYHQPKGDPV